MAKFQVGNKEGAKKGKHTKTKEWEALGEAIATRHAERFNTLLDESPPDRFLDKFLQVLEYFKPKLQRSEIKHEGDVSIQWNEVKNYDKKKE